MINSILERHCRRVTIDRVLITNIDDNSQTLVTDQNEIKVHVNAHFQQVAGGAQPRQTLASRWAAQYSPIARINEQWYDRIMDPPSIDEWSNIVSHLANGKAPGPSGVSNEMIKHVGPKMSKAIWQLVRLCCIYQDIPKGWREATVYPIPKPMDWESNLNKTRPITLLETIRKALVRLINSRLSKVMVHHSILRGGNHADLPGGSTLEPLRIVNAILEDARASKKELWILFQDMSKAYDRVNIHMLDLAMQRIKFPSAL